jgi:hypothetical protein
VAKAPGSFYSKRGDLILDNMIYVKRVAKEMAGLGWHYFSTDKRTTPCHSLFGGVYIVKDHQFTLLPQMYRQKLVCEQEGKTL